MGKSSFIMTTDEVDYIRAVYVAKEMYDLKLINKDDFWKYEKIISKKYGIGENSLYKFQEFYLSNVM